ncbi:MULTISPECIES: GntR family transcriptional regulator [unclassified Microbacterium]|uniref:GntR family transcriptional regulator n=1 Tax=unclassified Microbacterium TaxID=2609290 RepID=UPI001AE7D40C|nr:MULTISPECIES: GntR family transcriptional regulator [unclassified Microbacterium]MDQ1175998.1 DNA-binding transcriptional regulator YhcF (GntR family) [Microbacterium sp. SORGH_AS_0421]WAC69952.1 GntR family transcriptional regulator [Microbacterium sp. SL75]
MRLSVDATSSTPPFEQVRAQVIAQIEAGELVAGTRLPPVRALATELGLAANTVARTYRELEEAGYVETRGRAGTFVKGADAASARAAGAARTYVETVRRLGVSADDAVELVRAALRDR